MAAYVSRALGLSGLLLIAGGVAGPAVSLETNRLRRPDAGRAVTVLPYGLATRASAALRKAADAPAEEVSVTCFALPGLGPALLGGAATAFALVLGRSRREALAVAVGLLVFVAVSAGTVEADVQEFNLALQEARLGECVGALRVAWGTWAALVGGAVLLGVAGCLTRPGAAPVSAER
jgi:hypothetical protein